MVICDRLFILVLLEYKSNKIKSCYNYMHIMLHHQITNIGVDIIGKNYRYLCLYLCRGTYVGEQKIKFSLD